MTLPTCHRRSGRGVFESHFRRTSFLNDAGSVSFSSKLTSKAWKQYVNKAVRHNKRHENESASWVLAAVRLADGTCDPHVLVRPRFRRNPRR